MNPGIIAPESDGAEEHLVIFHLAGEEYGVPIGQVSEIIRCQEITQIPLTASDVEGVINLRGKIVPVLDLRGRLGLPAEPSTRVSRIVVIEIRGHTVGLIVDSVKGVLRLNGNSIEAPSRLVAELEDDFVRGVGKHEESLIILLNLDRALRLDEMIA